MADKSINDLNFAPGTIDDANTLFVVSQSGTAYKVSGHDYITALGTILDGHGGVKSIVYTPPTAPSLTGTMVITLADDSTTSASVQNGKGISTIAKTGTSGLVDTYTITYNDSTTQTFTVTNGEKGDTGDAWYVWIKYAGSQPTQDSDMGDTPDNWIGIYSGTSSTAPTHYTDYDWFEYKGEKGDTGDAATVIVQNVSYQTSSSGTVVPSGSWTSTIPTVTPGDFLWTRTQLQFNTGNPITTYSVSRYGIDGAGSVSTVNSVSPDASGNVALTADDIPMPNNLSVEDTIVQIETDVGDVSQLTTASSIVVGAINELKTNVTKLPESRLVGKQVAIYADSWGASYHGSFGADYISDYTGVSVHIASDPGGTLSRIYTNAWDSFNADVYVISGGLNDVGADTTITDFVSAINTWCTAIRNVNANAEIYFVTPPMMRTAAVHTNLYPLELYRIAIWRMAAIKGYNVINSLKWVDITLESDKTHPIVADAPKIGKHVVAAISNYGDEETHIQDYCNINGLLVSGGNNQLEYWCDAGSLFLRLQYFDQAYTSGSQVTVSFPSGYGMGTDIKSFAYTVMAGDVSPVFVQHSKDSNDVILYRKAATGISTIYIHGATIPVHVSPLFFSS